jgi:hypothetical protein
LRTDKEDRRSRSVRPEDVSDVLDREYVRNESGAACADDARLLTELTDGRLLGLLARIDPSAGDRPRTATGTDEDDLDAG